MARCVTIAADPLTGPATNVFADCVPHEAGAAPAPPPFTRSLAVNAAEDASVLEALKYGTPPDVPDAVSVNVPLLVTGDPLMVKIAGAAMATLVTVPGFVTGVAHVPS